ncbi:MAG: MgtC/SapB family protein [Bradymonadaceae bacterium]
MALSYDTWWQLALVLALGLLVGLERERSGHTTGIRTFPLIALLGAGSALLADHVGEWLVPAALLAVAGGVVTRERETGEQNEEQRGTTTLMAAFLMFVVGALAVSGYTSVAAALGGTTAVLLHWKEPLHEFVDRIDPEAKTAVFRFALIGVVVLPLLPDQTYGPYDVLNPFRIWLIVVLIVGISVAGYLIYEFLGARVGLVLGGVLGGIVSSTAATVAYARRSSKAPAASSASAAAIMIASTLAFVRIVVEVAVVAPALSGAVLPKFAVLIGVMTVGCIIAYATADPPDESEAAQPEDPAALKAAFVFGALYAVILFAVAAAKANFGNQGLYVVATLSGLTDVDAITLSTAEMMSTDRIAVDTGWRMMLIGGLSNVVFKGGAVALLGDRRLFTRIALLFGGTLAAGIAVIALWPTG